MTSVFSGIDDAVVEVEVAINVVAGGAVGGAVATTGDVGKFLFSLSDRDRASIGSFSFGEFPEFSDFFKKF